MAKTRWDWNLLRHGNGDDAIRELRAAHSREDSSSIIMELGIAYLWLGDYAAAWEHFGTATQKYPKHTDAFYEMAGAAKWCMNEPATAVGQWLTGLECRYADAAGGVRCPLLLFTASIIRPGAFSRPEAAAILSTRADFRRIKRWPGAVAEFVLGRIDNAALRERCIGRDESDTLTRNWFADFHRGVLALGRGEVSAYGEAMTRTATVFDDDFDVEKGHFLSKLWHAIFFVARHES